MNMRCNISLLRTISLVAATLLLINMRAQADNHDKLSYDLQQLRSDYQARRASSSNNFKSVCAFVRMRHDHAEEILADYDCEVSTKIKDIYIAQIPIAQLDALDESDAVVRVETHFGGKPLLDVIPTWVHHQPVYAGTGLPQAYDGSGVLLGIVDGGFDLTHPSFYSIDGATYRIKGFVDDYANEEETIGIPTPLGRQYTTQEELLEKAHSGDQRASHGTHCLGIAAGSGYGTDYKGIAYGADIYAVSTRVGTESAYGSASEVARMKHIFDYADEKHQPCVITYSIGFNDNPMDAQLFTEALEGLTGEGRIIVVAAGNENLDKNYIKKEAGIETAGTALHVTHQKGVAYFQSEQSFALKCITLRTIDGLIEKSDSVLLDSDQLPTDSMVVNGHHLLMTKTGTFYTLTDRCEKSQENAYSSYLMLAIEGQDAEVEMYGTIDSSFDNSLCEKLNDYRFDDAVSGYNVDLPGTLSQMITVGALNGRYSYLNMEGKERKGHGASSPVGTIAVFSSVGPTKDGRVKPDIVAPGVNILSAINSYDSSDRSSSTVQQTVFNGHTYSWAAMSGTSMATPCVAGIVALWLQADPTLTPEKVKEVFKSTARHPEEQLAYPNTVYGYGLIDAYEGILTILGIPSAIEQVSMHQPSSLRIRPRADQSVLLDFDTAPTEPFHVRVYTLTGQLLTEHRFNPTSAMTYYLDVPKVSSGVYVVQVNSMEAGITGSELIRF